MAGKQAPRPSQLSIPEPQDNPSEFVINQVCSEGHGRRPMKENQALDSLRLTLHANAIKAAKAKKTRMKNAQLHSQPLDNSASNPQWETHQNQMTPSHAIAQSNPNLHYPFTGVTEQSFMEQLCDDDLTWPGVTTSVHSPAMPTSPWTPARPMSALPTHMPASTLSHGVIPRTTPTATRPSQEFNLNTIPSTPTPRVPLAPLTALNYALSQPQQQLYAQSSNEVNVQDPPHPRQRLPSPALIPFEDDDPEYQEDAWVQKPVDNHQHKSKNEEDHLEKSTDNLSRRGLQMKMCSVEPKSMKKRKWVQRKKDHAARKAQSDASDGGNSDDQVS